ncbi:dephospho-CoA kinase [soil metagenome]
MIWVGLTGGIASGKTTVAEIFSSLGVAVVGADQLAHDAMASGSAGADEVRASFGDDVFKPDGSVDRPKLGALVFGDGTGVLRTKLEAILHPAVRRQSEIERTRLEARGDKVAVYEIPLLFEKNLEHHFDIIVTVAVAPEIQMDRLVARNKLSLDDARARIAAQLSQDKKVHASDFVIWNDADVAHLRRQVEKIVLELKREPLRR